MTGYVRQSETEIQDDEIILSADLNAEFDAIEAFADATTGHTHDGTIGGGAPIAYGDITGTPTLSTVATSGNYSDLSGLPTLGTISSQDANNINITGGSITGITDLAIADGGTGASSAVGARANLGIGWELISLITPTAVSAIDLVDLSPFSIVRIQGIVKPANDIVKLLAQTSSNNGSSFDSGASDYGYSFRYAAAAVVTTNTAGSTSGINLNPGNSVGNNTNEWMTFELTFFNFNKATWTSYATSAQWVNESGAYQDGVYQRGFRVSTTARDAIRLAWTAGNFAATGQILVEGVRG